MATTTNRSSSAVADDTTAGTARSPAHPLAEAGHEAGDTAARVGDRATGIGFAQADRIREQAADGLQQLATSVRRSSGDLESEQPAIANAVDTAADQAERIAAYLRQTDARELVGTIQDVARRQPLLFVGGAFLLGVAASRFVKAAGGSSPQNAMPGTSSDPRADDATFGSAGTVAATGGFDDGYRATGPGGAGTLSGSIAGTDQGLRR